MRRFTVRRPRLDELDALTELDRAVFGKDCYTRMTFRQFHDLAGMCFQIALDESGMLGYALILPSAEPGEGWLMSLCVSVRSRGTGVGRALAEQVFRQADLCGIKLLRLTVDPGNVVAVSLYESLGFVHERSENDYYAGDSLRSVLCRSTSAG